MKKLSIWVWVILSATPSIAPADLLPDIYVHSTPFLPTIHFEPKVIGPGGTITVNWKVSANAMWGIPEDPPPPQFPPAYGPWDDGIFLSVDSQWDTGDVFLGAVRFDGVLYAGQQYQKEHQLLIHLNTDPGYYKIIVYTDYLGVLSENSETNNYADSENYLHIIPEPATMALLGLGGMMLLRKKR